MNTQQEKAYIEFLKSLCAEFPNAAALLDRTLSCIYSSRPALFSEGMAFQSIVHGDLSYPMREFTQVRVMIRDEFYCARIVPIKNEYGDPWLYVCELVNASSATDIAADTDLFARALPVLNSIEYNLAGLWKNTNALGESLGGDSAAAANIGALKSSLANIGSVTKNASEFAGMMFGEKDPVAIDAAALMTSLVRRCNAALAKCGRRVELLCDSTELIIGADCRHAVAALVNAVQNALLYSPRDSVPIIAVYRICEGKRAFVEFKFTNDNIMFTDKDFKDNVSVNFSYQRIGWGIPIIRRFAEESHGRFSIEDDGGRMCVRLTLPSPVGELSPEVSLEQFSYVYYNTGVPDILETKMREVAEFFGENG